MPVGVDRAAFQSFVPTQPTQIALDGLDEAAPLGGCDVLVPPSVQGSAPDASLPPSLVAPTPSVLAAPEDELEPLGMTKRARTFGRR